MLPVSEFIDQDHINNPCTRVQFAADACPPLSVLGHATATTPLLDQPLKGPVYFRSNGGDRELPDIVADLQGPIHVTLVGFVDAVPVKGTEQARIRTRFQNVPDAPVTQVHDEPLRRRETGPAGKQPQPLRRPTAGRSSPSPPRTAWCGTPSRGSRRVAGKNRAAPPIYHRNT